MGLLRVARREADAQVLLEVVLSEVESVLTEGEAWTREQLELLLVARFSPAAIWRFLAASQRRAGDVRRHRPALTRQSRAWLAAGAAAWALPAAAGWSPSAAASAMGSRGGLPWP